MEKEELRIVDLTESNFDDLAGAVFKDFPCRVCLYWLSPEFPPPMEDSERKKQWLTAVAEEVGSVGKIAYLQEKPVAWIHYSFPKYLRREAFAPHTPDPEALFICCLVVADESRGKGTGSDLLTAVLKEAETRDIKAVETVARKKSPNNPAGPADLYLKSGFKIKKDDPEFPLLRFTIGKS